LLFDCIYRILCYDNRRICCK